MIRRAAYLASVAVVAWAAVVVPMPFFEVQPGGAHPVEDLITLSAATGEVDGDLDLLTTRQSTPNAVGAVWIGLHPERDLEPATDRTPADIDLDRYFEIQEQAFRTSFLTAVAVAAEEAGATVDLRTRAIVAQVLPSGPSHGLLEPGDRITAIDGVPVDSGAALVAELERSDEERPVTLEVRGDEEERTREVTVELRRMAEVDHPALGVIVETVADEPDLPFEAELQDTNIVGPSAGLMIALTATDLLLEEDLTRGRIVAGTGTITLGGTVGRVSGVPQKARAAIAAGADLLLVPAEQLAEADAAADAGIEVVGVRNYEEALAAVRGRAGS